LSYCPIFLSYAVTDVGNIHDEKEVTGVTYVGIYQNALEF